MHSAASLAARSTLPRHEQRVESEWRGATAGGCINFDTVRNNPQFLLTIKQPTHCLICLAQADPRGMGGAEAESFAIGLTVCFKGGAKVTKIYTSDWSRDTGSFSYQREVSLDVPLEMRGSGATTAYTLLPSTFKPGQERSFSIRVWSEQPCELKPLE